MVLEELGLTYEPIFLDPSKNELKTPPHIDYNPNGRIPTLIDHHNGDFAIWESDAILLYLADKYDTEKKLTVTDDKEKYTLIQWLFFQASGQGYVSFIPSLSRASSRAFPRYSSRHELTHGSCRTQPVLWPGILVHELPPREGPLRDRALPERDRPRHLRARHGALQA